MLSSAVVQAAATSGSSATISVKCAQRLLDPAWHRLSLTSVKYGHLADQVQVDLGDQMVLRREVGVGGRRGDLGAGGDGAHGQVGVRRLAQHFHACGEDLAEGLLLAAVARRLAGLPASGVIGSHGIAGHMSKLSDRCAAGQARPENCSYKPLTDVAAATSRVLPRPAVWGYRSKELSRTVVQQQKRRVGMALLADRQSQLLIDGKLVAGSAGTFPTVNPATEEVLGVAADATVDDMGQRDRGGPPRVRRHRLVDQHRVAGALHASAAATR